jgi:hypothetical protein
MTPQQRRKRTDKYKFMKPGPALMTDVVTTDADVTRRLSALRAPQRCQAQMLAWCQSDTLELDFRAS